MRFVFLIITNHNNCSTERKIVMKNPRRRKSLRMMLLSAIMIAAVSGASVFFAVSAAENTEQPENVTVSDVAVTSDESAEDTAGPAAEEENAEMTVDAGFVTAEQVADVSHQLFMPNAQYNGSFRSELLPNELPFYDALYTSMITNGSNDPVRVEIEDMGYSVDQLSNVQDLVLSAYAAFSTDHPEVYWVGGYGGGYSHDGTTILSYTIKPSERYEGAYSERSTVLSGIDSAVSVINSSRESSSRYDTVKAIHDYICNTMDYDYSAAETGNYGEAHTAAPLFGGGSRGHQFVCEGYANSLKILCDRFGIPAVHVKGDAGGPHSWNYVQMEDNCWYGVDCTWDDQSTLLYTYFLIGSNTTVFNGKRFEEDHVPEDQVMTTPTVNPLAYPELSYDKYVLGESFDFYGSTGVDNREVCGSVDFVWKYRGNMSEDASLYLSVDGSQIATLSMDASGFFYYTLDVSQMTNGTHTVQAVFHRLGGTDITVSRTIIVSNPDFDFVNWPNAAPVVSRVYNVRMKQTNGGSSIQCQVDFYIDDSRCATLYCDNEGYFSYDIDPASLSDGNHTIKAIFTNASGLSIERTKQITVANPAIEIYNKQDNPTVSGTFTVDIRAYNCGTSDDFHVDFYVDDALVDTLSDSSGVFSYAIDTTQLANGSHTYRAVLVTNFGVQLSDSGTFVAANVIPAQAVSLDRNAAELPMGQTLVLSASVIPANSTDEIVWSSGNPDIATVKPNGIVTAVGVGETTINATAGSVSSSCVVTVTAPPASYPVTINKSSVKLFITDNTKAPSTTLSAKKPKYIKSVVWYSDDPSVASVDKKGKVTGHKNGTANIYCKFANGETVSAPCLVYVNLFTIDTANLTALDSCRLINGVYWTRFNDSASLGIVDNDLSPDAATDPIVWKSGSSAVSVDGSGYITCNGKKGTVTITASKGKSLKTSIKVRAYQPTEMLALNNYNPSVYIKKSVTLKSYLSKGSDEPVFWRSSDEAVATVSEKGVVKGISQGTATITAYTMSGYEQYAAVTVRTGATAFTWDTLQPGMNPRNAIKYCIGIGESKEISVRITAPDNCNDTVTWTNSNKKAVDMTLTSADNNTVTVTGIAKGTASVVAKTGSGKKVTYQIIVVPLGAEQIQLTKNNVSLYTGASLQLSAKVLPKDSNDAVIWNSADTGIATVDENGKITAVGQGDTTITAYSPLTGASDVASVHVMTKATGLTWDTVPEGLTPRSTVKYALNINPLECMELGVIVTSPENCNDTVTWTNSNKKAVLMVLSDNTDRSVTVYAQNPGTANITAKTGSGKKITYQIVVISAAAESINSSKSDVTVYQGATAQLSAAVLPKGCKDVVMWYSYNPDVATVDENGRVSAVAQGETAIIAYSSCNDEPYAVVQIHVLTKATGLTWSTVPDGMTPRGTVKYAIAPGEEKSLSVAITAPENCNDIVTWSNNNRKVVEMTLSEDNGKTVTVRGLAKGTATITARTGSGKKVTYQISVVPASAQSITLNKQAATVYTGASLQLTAKIAPKGCNDVILWKSENPDVAKVDETGRITGVSNGSTDIIAYSATTGTLTARASVNVITKATAIDVDTTDVYLGVGESFNVTATVTAADCEDTVAWSTSNKAIATVTPAGNTATITAVKLGNCTVTVKTGSGKYQKINVSVYK